MFARRKKATPIKSLDELDPLVASGKPVLIDFMQMGCAPCRVMDGIMNELAAEYPDSAHVVKIDVAKVPGAAEKFNVRSTPTFVLLGRPQPKNSAKSKKANRNKPNSRNKVTSRWRANGLIPKDQISRVLESNGARPS
ncbi:MAG: thioredoxin family protein [Acidimicrobiia bacterium]|nr:thioredoxin family protein [Acidimicrobiia bacterium]